MESNSHELLTILFVLLLSVMGVWMKIPIWKTAEHRFSTQICTLIMMSLMAFTYWLLEFTRNDLKWWHVCERPYQLLIFSFTLPLALSRALISINFSASNIGISMAFPIWVASGIVTANSLIVLGYDRFQKVLHMQPRIVELNPEYFAFSLVSIVGSLLGLAGVRYLAQGIYIAGDDRSDNNDYGARSQNRSLSYLQVPDFEPRPPLIPITPVRSRQNSSTETESGSFHTAATEINDDIPIINTELASPVSQFPTAFAVSPSQPLPRQPRNHACIPKSVTGIIYACMGGISSTAVIAHQAVFLATFDEMFPTKSKPSRLSVYIEACISPMIVMALLLALMRLSKLVFTAYRARTSVLSIPMRGGYSAIGSDDHIEDTNDIWERYEGYEYRRGPCVSMSQLINELWEVIAPSFTAAFSVVGCIMISFIWLRSVDGLGQLYAVEYLNVITSAMLIGVLWWGLTYLQELSVSASMMHLDVMPMSPMYTATSDGYYGYSSGGNVKAACSKFGIITAYIVFLGQLIASYYCLSLISWRFIDL